MALVTYYRIPLGIPRCEQFSVEMETQSPACMIDMCSGTDRCNETIHTLIKLTFSMSTAELLWNRTENASRSATKTMRPVPH